MGLASKLAASSNQSGDGYAGYPTVYQPQGEAQQPVGQGFQQQSPPQSHAPPAKQGPLDELSVRRRLGHIVAVNGLHTFYSEARLNALARDVTNSDLRGLADRWRLDSRLLLDLVALALYDIVIMADDSGSMKACENGTRIEDLQAMLCRITDAVTLFDTDGISVRFMNQDLAGNNIKNAQDVVSFVNQAKYGGVTPLGTMLDRKILQPFVRAPAKAGRMPKPVSVIIITDGEPCGEPDGTIKTVIKDTKKTLAKSHFGEKAVTFQFVQVGRDEDARKFLGKLDTDAKIGGMVDATSYFEYEQEEYRKNYPNTELTPEMYLVKLLLGAIDPAYDKSDETEKKKKGFFSMFK